MGGKPLKVILIPDYCNGGDVIITDTRIGNMLGLKGKRIGCEFSSLGIYILQRALHRAGLSRDDVDLVNIEQSQGAAALEAGDIDAFVAYPPASIGILQQARYYALFFSSEIPHEIIDRLSLSEDVFEASPCIVPEIHQAWQMVLDFTVDHPEKAYEIMAQREGISIDDVRHALSDLLVLNREEQYKLFHDPKKWDAMMNQICKTLVQINNINVECQALTLDLEHIEQASLLSIASRELANASIYRCFKKDSGGGLRITISRERK
jgi:NitT/TauT family transport system substrate-binding protein